MTFDVVQKNPPPGRFDLHFGPVLGSFGPIFYHRIVLLKNEEIRKHEI